MALSGQSLSVFAESACGYGSKRVVQFTELRWARPENQLSSRDLTRREMLILRSLMEGASNKVIALKLVMTKSTVKVHVKAILRKLRLQNCTQAAIWARDHLGVGDEISVFGCQHWRQERRTSRQALLNPSSARKFDGFP